MRDFLRGTPLSNYLLRGRAHRFLLVVLVFVLFGIGGAFLKHGEANEIKNLSFFVGQESAAVSGVSWPFTFLIADDTPAVQSAFFEVNGIAPDSGSLSFDFSLSGGLGACPLARSLDTTGRHNEFSIIYDVTSCIGALAPGEQSRTLAISIGGGSVDSLSARFLLSYEYTELSSVGPTSMKSLRFAVDEGTASSSVPAGQNIVLDSSFFMGDDITVVANAFYEINGVSLAAGASNISLSLGGGSGACADTKTLDTSGAINTFHLLYDITNCINITGRGTFSRSLTLNASGGSVYVYSAALVVTYQFTPHGGVYPASAVLTSPVFDTETVNGASFNSLTVKGPRVPGTKVRVRFATSNSSSTASFTFLGPDCSPSSYYYDAALPDPNEPRDVGCYATHHNKRFFRYEVTLCSTNSCVAGGNFTPEVDDVLINWSP